MSGIEGPWPNSEREERDRLDPPDPELSRPRPAVDGDAPRGAGHDTTTWHLRDAPTLSEWLEGWEAEVEAGQSHISRAEAVKRWRKQHDRDTE